MFRMPNSHKEVSDALPEWLVSANNQLNEATNALTVVHTSLTGNQISKDDKLYSTVALHKYVGKETLCKTLLNKITTQIEEYKKQVEANTHYFNKEYIRINKTATEIEISRLALIQLIIEWQKNYEAKYRIEELAYKKLEQENKILEQQIRNEKEYKEAENAFINLKEKLAKDYAEKMEEIKRLSSITKGANEYNIQTILNSITKFQSQEYANFLNNFKMADLDVSSLNEKNQFERCKPKLKFIPSLPMQFQSISSAELAKKNVSELKKWVDIRAPVQLKKTANDLLLAYHENETLQKALFNVPPPSLFTLNINVYNELLLNAIQTSEEYESAARVLAINSKLAYDDIEAEITLLFSKIEDYKRDLEAKHVDFLFHGKATQNYTDASMHEWIKLFVELKKYYDGITEVNENASKHVNTLIQKFQDAGEKFGSFHAKEVNELRNKINFALDDLRESNLVLKNENNPLKAKDTLEKFETKVLDFRRMLLADEIIVLIRTAIEKNIGFWNEQISKRFGSRSLLKGVPAPKGICDMFDKIRSRSIHTSATSFLDSIKSIAVSRQRWGQNFFRLRSLETTDQFYSIIANIDVMNLTPVSVAQIKTDLAKLRYVNAEHEIIKLNLDVPKSQVVETRRSKQQPLQTLPTQSPQEPLPIIPRVRLIN